MHTFGNLADVEVSDFSPFPAGTYLMQASKVGDLKKNNAGTGAYVPVEFEVVDGEHRGRKIFENFSYMHENPKTEQIALQRTKQWILATGRDGNIELTTDVLAALEGQEFTAEVTIKPDSNGVNKNQIRYFVIPEGDAPPKPAPKPEASKPSAGKAKKPWEK